MSFVNGDNMGDTVAKIHYDSSGTARRIEGQHSLHGDVHGRCVERLEHDLGDLLPVDRGVEGGLSEEIWVLLWGHTQLVVEGVVPDILHVVPVSHSSILNWMAEVQAGNSSLGPSLGPHVRVLIARTHWGKLLFLVAGTSHDGGERHPVRRNVTQCNATLMLRFKNAPKVAEIANLPWVVVTSKASFAPAGTIVENYSTWSPILSEKVF